MRPEDATPQTVPGGPAAPRISWFRRFLSWLFPSRRSRPPALPPPPALPSAPPASPHPAAPGLEPASPVVSLVEPPQLPTEPLRRLMERLELEEVEPQVRRALLAELQLELPPERWAVSVDVYSAAAHILMRWCKVTGPLEIREGGLSVVALIGPTGVGKSTTLAKLAAISAHKDRRSVGLISTDTYRIAAADQIRVYAQLLGLPLAVVRTREEMEAALREYATRDLVFIDTAGQSPNEHERLSELGELLGADVQIRRHLVLSATTKTSDIKHILKRFDPLGFDGIIVTKLDESNSHGILMNAPHWSGRPLVYLGVGQGVPADIEVASKERVAVLLLNLAAEFPLAGR